MGNAVQNNIIYIRNGCQQLTPSLVSRLGETAAELV